jgi:hypothetical protein
MNAEHIVLSLGGLVVLAAIARVSTLAWFHKKPPTRS